MPDAFFLGYEGSNHSRRARKFTQHSGFQLERSSARCRRRLRRSPASVAHSPVNSLAVK
ncbi:hypothetical protein K443DRAFT_683597 [Laccaria amethystina LaAM-08-1]|uniref:Uncharacterized protein n=1 Tax=Laccaria amethystina LaAM-08-1 TaxID=1095629 RepID=A0A0C9WSG2_9AGAR|nr:hypothetical protein K443DRAFT_683597 [Laccaria amethystina LaAM-08-1]